MKRYVRSSDAYPGRLMPSRYSLDSLYKELDRKVGDSRIFDLFGLEIVDIRMTKDNDGNPAVAIYAEKEKSGYIASGTFYVTADPNNSDTDYIIVTKELGNRHVFNTSDIFDIISTCLNKNLKSKGYVDSSKRISRRRVMASEMPTGPMTVTFIIDRIKDIRWFKVSEAVKETPKSKSLFGYDINCRITVSGRITRIEGKTFDEPCDIKFDMDIRSIILKANLLRDVEIDDRGSIDTSEAERILRNAGLIKTELVSEYGYEHNILHDDELGLEFEGDFDLRARNQMEDIIIKG